ncbi:MULTISPECIES: APC family permease [Chryseobacterium]|uniref:APA family basic amino acid/polyamine antiporter n=1 Tax=Chryseobacterium camelliae TaxID=1265445 RepID=A0ABU0TI70_9FLAO|nr:MULTISPECIES: amino acid permease [Chryseobacterium]MDT3409629.1 APA family basic amino acid/polyamine antiporter [Pseudacidovorax intermedius]MDQ1096511.1 APA family basic amino acid/polyamine antiporter [Chryseobacterium camelliae]MDQ1100451.1 APA family basic amino acid/polyamine antiporter [Chryseobacterium sp. SORGH_AS_1048]MDR6087791.1 APA family basic amino acid/polyamine antiporter [Chryseobacterium sp. SORGH_AS_0909]MDR6132167.1 APA family basic amino acid/polyamine antiporter [Chr
MGHLFKRKVYSETDTSTHLSRVLGVWDIVFFGIAAIIGAGSFSSLGEAVFRGGPGVILLYLICGFACGFTALCYAEFASRIPTAGSAYTYAYASFGELIAWIIGWALIMEYSFGNIYVAFSWSDYFTSFLERLGMHIPDYLTCSYTEARKAFMNGSENQELVNAWKTAPLIGSLKCIVDVPALVINGLITWLCYVGVKESKNFNNTLVILKLAVIILVVLVGFAYINTDNWTPMNPQTHVESFMPNGFAGVMSAVSGVFFAYIGFDALSVLSEETKDPQKTLPKGMIISLVLCTVIYIALTLVLTGMVDYRKFDGVGDPLSFIFEKGNANVAWMELTVSFVAIVAITTVLLVFQMGQPRIWYVMSRDGLMPKKFQTVHPKYKTPSFATIITGIVVGIPILFTDKSFILDFTSIGTIFAFVLVCAGVLMLPAKQKIKGRFHLPYINGRFIFPVIFIGGLVGFYILQPSFFEKLMDWKDPSEGEFRASIFFFILINLVLCVIAFVKKLSLIPLIGLSSCLYLLTGMSHDNWFWFGLWFAIGLVIYFCYGYRNSKLGQQS